MSGCSGVLRAELYRLRHSKAVRFSALFVMLVAVLRVWGESVIQATSRAAIVQRALERGASPPELAPANAFAPLVEGWLSALTVGSLLLLILASRSMAADRESGVLRLARTRSAGRGAIVVGRALLGIPLVLGLVAISGVAAWTTAALLFDFGPLVEHGFELLSVETFHEELQRAVLATIPPLLANWTFGLAISASSRSASTALGTSLAAYLGFDLFKQVLGDGQWWVFASFAPSFSDSSAMNEMTGVARGLSDAGYSTALYNKNMLLPWPEALLLVGVAWWATRRRAL
ncbi:MAG: hypothetical protein ACI9EF_001042 [Pseudohongiellaceae bacterium]|jgi:hypothetical protein